MIRITGVMIVRNEATRLAACLDALQLAVDEIVIVDTGSTDGTLDVARSYTTNCYSTPWCNDFAQARNSALGYATGDFALVVDADEILESPKDAGEMLRDFASTISQNCVGTVAIHNVFIDRGVQCLHIDHVERFFPKNQFFYTGAIHEQLTPRSGEKSSQPTGLQLMHTGYLHEPSDPNHKARRNIPILEEALANNPEDEYLHFQLGKAQFSLQEWKQAATALEAALKRIDFSVAAPTGSQGPVARAVLTDLICSLAYSRINLDDLPSAIALLKKHFAIGHPGTDWADFHHTLGYALLLEGRLEEARTAFQAAIAKGPGCEDVTGTSSFSTLYHLGLIHEAEDNLTNALNHYLTALQINPAYPPVIQRCVDLIVEHGIVLPEIFFALVSMETLERFYIATLIRVRDMGNAEAVAALCKVAEARAPQLFASCTALLHQTNGE